MTYIKDQIPYKFNPPCNTCPGTEIQLDCGNILCSEIDENDDPIYREYPSPRNLTFNFKRRENSATGKQVGNVSPCRLSMTITGVNNEDPLISPEDECPNIDGTYESIISWNFNLCNGLYSNVNMGANAYLTVENDGGDYSIEGIGDGKLRNVYLVVIFYYYWNFINFSTAPPQTICAAFKGLAGQIEYKVLGPEQGVSTPTIVFGNSNVECTKWNNLQLDYIADPANSKVGVEASSYLKVCDFSNAKVYISSINHRDNAWDRFNKAHISGFLPGSDSPGGMFRDPRRTININGEDVEYYSSPQSFELVFDGIENGGTFTDNRKCYDCDKLNNSHFLRLDAGVYSKFFRYQDDKINPETPICDKRERTLFRDNPCFPSGTSIDEITMYFSDEGMQSFLNVDVYHNPTFNNFAKDLIARYRKQIFISQGEDSLIPQIEGGMNIHEISPLGSGICNFSESSLNIKRFGDENDLTSCFDDRVICYSCSKQNRPESLLLTSTISNNTSNLSHEFTTYTFSVNKENDIISQISISLVFDEDECLYKYEDEAICEEIGLVHVFSITSNSKIGTGTTNREYHIGLKVFSATFNPKTGNLVIGYIKKEKFVSEASGESNYYNEYELCSDGSYNTCGSDSGSGGSVEDPDSGGSFLDKTRFSSVFNVDLENIRRRINGEPVNNNTVGDEHEYWNFVDCAKINASDDYTSQRIDRIPALQCNGITTRPFDFTPNNPPGYPDILVFKHDMSIQAN